MKKKWIAYVLCFVLLVTSFPLAAFANKKDEKGEVLNFAPFVDFELKEKEKVDVIVDIGNTSLSMDQANTLVNETLRPMLQSSGKDFKLHIEKSNEGSDKIYYFASTIRNNTFLYDIYYYDVNTRSSVFVKEYMGTASQEPGDPIYDPINDVIITPTYLIPLKQGVTYVNNGRISVARPGHTYPTTIEKPFMTQDGHYVFNITGKEFQGTDTTYGMAAIKATDLVNNTTSALSVRINDYNFSHKTRSEYLGNDVLYVAHFGASNDRYNYWLEIRNAVEVYYNSQTPIQNTMISSYVETSPTFFKQTGEIMYQKNYVNNNKSSTIGVETFIFNPQTKTSRSFQLGGRYGVANMYAVEDNQLVYKELNSDKTYFYEDYTDESTKTELSATAIPTPITHASNVIAYMNTNGSTIHFMNLHTKTIDTVSGSNRYKIVKYPKWYSAKKVQITDIINKGIYRADADKYYIRLDDFKVSQFENGQTVGKLAAAFASQDITFISLGSNANEQWIQRFITTINDNGLFINTGQRRGDFAKATQYIEQKKKAHVLLLQGDQTYTTAQLQQMANEMTNVLKLKNISLKTTIVQDSYTNLFELLDRQSWYDDVNQYVLYIHRGNVVPLTNEGIRADVAALLRGNYAFFIGNSSTTNQTHFNALLEANHNQGFITSGSMYSAVASAAATYIVQSAIQNPKRVSDTLVLQHDPVTGEYSSEVIVTTHYEDFEHDPKGNERFKTTHDPTVYENHSGVMEGIGQYHESPTTRFTKVGRYEMVVQGQDKPIPDIRFQEYWKWSKDSLSQLVLYVHRAPIAEFTTRVNSSRVLTVTDLSYDLDRYSQYKRGIVKWEWKWKRVQDAAWTAGNAPTTLQANTDYLISLKVRDMDGAWSNETIKFVTTNPYNQPPVALFTVDPPIISHTKESTITDLSYDPDGDLIVTREWKVYRDKQLLLESATKPTVSQMKQAAQSKGLQALGKYRIELKVQDQPGLWSETHREMLEVINHAPIADFEPIKFTYRDTVNTIINTTVAPDLDGDPVSYAWTLIYKDKRYPIGTARNASFKIKDRALGKNAIGTWMLELKASDPLGAHSYMTHSFEVVNQPPITRIASGAKKGYINQPYAYTSISSDPDTEDNNNLQSFWKLTTPSGKVRTWTTKNISITYDEKGEHTLDHWVVDPLDEKSEVDSIAVMIENLVPIPGFTMTPNPTYRGVDVSIKSTATDLDGYIESHHYYVTPSGSTSKTYLGSFADFIRSFSSVGNIAIEQVVIDNDGAEARLTKMLTILNRKPIATVTTPSGTNGANATKFNTLTPRIEWTMYDADGDSQHRYQVQIKQGNGTALYTSNVVNSSNKFFVIPASVGLSENTLYRATVRIYDGYDWSDYATDKYFYIVTNQPPVAGFVWNPISIWEGDNVTLSHRVSDPDMDLLQIRYKVTDPNGRVTYYPSERNYYQASKDNYNSTGPILNRVSKGSYTIEQSVYDPLGEFDTITKSFTVRELSVVGKVKHTEQWENMRKSYNEKNPNSYWNENQFLAGEKLVIEALTTLTSVDDSTITFATQVEAQFIQGNAKVLMGNNSLMRNEWNGEMWESSFSNLKNDHYQMIFTATYSNGVIKQHIVTFEIIGTAESIAGVHRVK